MDDEARLGRKGLLLDLLGYPIVLVACFGYLLLRIDPAVIYHRFAARFYLPEWRALSNVLARFEFADLPRSLYSDALSALAARPGGPVVWLSAQATECYAIGWLGSLWIAVAAVLLSMATGELIATQGGRRSNPAKFLPALAMLLIYNQCGNAMPLTLSLTVAIAAAALYGRLGNVATAPRACAFVVLLGATFYLAGAACLVLVLVAALFELWQTRQRLFAVACLVLGGAVVFYGGLWTVGHETNGWSAHLLRLPYPPLRLTVGPVAYGVVAFLVVIAVAMRLVRPRVVSRAERRRGQADQSWRHWLDTSPRDRLVILLLLLCIATAVLLPTFDSRYHAIMALDYRGTRGRWQAVLDTARDFPGGVMPTPMQHEVIRALYETGGLGESLFAYAIGPDALMMLGYERSRGDMSRLARTYFELGRLNESEWHASNWFEVFGERPVLLQLLAEINLAKGRNEVARMYLRALRRFTSHAAWAEAALRDIEQAAPLAAPVRAGGQQAVPVADSVIDTRRTSAYEERALLALLDRDPTNRRAMEYLMTHYLLSMQTGKLVAQLHRLKGLGYSHIPRHWEEAVLIHDAGADTASDLGGYTIRQRTRRRYEAFRAAMSRSRAAHHRDELAVGRELWPEFGDTYAYYYRW
jgi:Family of unknown function (DUF6057)